MRLIEVLQQLKCIECDYGVFGDVSWTLDPLKSAIFAIIPQWSLVTCYGPSQVGDLATVSMESLWTPL